MEKKKLSSNPLYIGFLTAFLGGIAVNLFGLVNILNNHDNVVSNPSGYGSSIQSGRWFLAMLGRFFGEFWGNHNLAWLNGLLAVFLMAVSLYFILKIFQVKSRFTAGVLGILWISFPSFSACLLFRFTVFYYSVSILLAVLSVYCAITLYQKHRIYGLLLSGFLGALSLGIYQAYITISASILVLYLIQQMLSKDTDWKPVLLSAFYYLFCLILSLVIYFVAMNLSLKISGTELLSYQGISDMGKISIRDLPLFIWNAFYKFFTMPEEDPFMLSYTFIPKYSYIFAELLSVIILITACIANRTSLKKIVLLAVFGILFPVAVNLYEIMCANTKVYTLMVQSFVMVLFMPAILMDSLPKANTLPISFRKLLNIAVCTLLTLITFTYAYLANVNYTAQYYRGKQAENLANAFVIQARMTEGFSADQEWVFIGRYEDSLMRNQWDHSSGYQSYMHVDELVNSYAWPAYISNYTGYVVPLADKEKYTELQNSAQVRAMPCWPDYGSVEIIEDTVVIKLGDPANGINDFSD